MSLDFNELRQLLITLSQTDITELSLKSDDFELTIRKGVAQKNQDTPTQSVVNQIGQESYSSPLATAATDVESRSKIFDLTVSNSVQPIVSPPSDPKAEISSPMVGTFYRSPAPGEAPFVEVGDRVRVGQTVCIIEAMKLMNEIEAEVSGQIAEILVQNGEPIEFGQALMRINPD